MESGEGIIGSRRVSSGCSHSCMDGPGRTTTLFVVSIIIGELSDVIVKVELLVSTHRAIVFVSDSTIFGGIQLLAKLEYPNVVGCFTVVCTVGIFLVEFSVGGSDVIEVLWE